MISSFNKLNLLLQENGGISLEEFGQMPTKEIKKKIKDNSKVEKKPAANKISKKSTAKPAKKIKVEPIIKNSAIDDIKPKTGHEKFTDSMSNATSSPKKINSWDDIIPKKEFTKTGKVTMFGTKEIQNAIQLTFGVHPSHAIDMSHINDRDKRNEASNLMYDHLFKKFKTNKCDNPFIPDIIGEAKTTDQLKKLLSEYSKQYEVFDGHKYPYLDGVYKFEADIAINEHIHMIPANHRKDYVKFLLKALAEKPGHARTDKDISHTLLGLTTTFKYSDYNIEEAMGELEFNNEIFKDTKAIADQIKKMNQEIDAAGHDEEFNASDLFKDASKHNEHDIHGDNIGAEAADMFEEAAKKAGSSASPKKIEEAAKKVGSEKAETVADNIKTHLEKEPPKIQAAAENVGMKAAESLGNKHGAENVTRDALSKTPIHFSVKYGIPLFLATLIIYIIWSNTKKTKEHKVETPTTNRFSLFMKLKNHLHS